MTHYVARFDHHFTQVCDTREEAEATLIAFALDSPGDLSGSRLSITAIDLDDAAFTERRCQVLEIVKRVSHLGNGYAETPEAP